MNDTLDLPLHGPVIPVIVLQHVADAVPLAQALLAGGVRVLEITLRTPAALACIEAIAKNVPQALMGAGTVRSSADAQSAKDAGAAFAVSPGYTPLLGRPADVWDFRCCPARRLQARSWQRKTRACVS